MLRIGIFVTVVLNVTLIMLSVAQYSFAQPPYADLAAPVNPGSSLPVHAWPPVSYSPSPVYVEQQEDPAPVLPVPTHANRQVVEFANQQPSTTEEIPSVPVPGTIPLRFYPWWQSAAVESLRPAPSSTKLTNSLVIVETLRHSARVRVISDNIVVARSNITRADAEFDVRAFMDSKMIKTSVPTGSDLDAGFGVPRLREEDWYYNAGVRKKNRFGGRFEAAQQIGTRDSNSEFFSPLDQGNSRLTLSYNQPLLSGYGKVYNNSLILLANFDTRIASDRTAAELQDHLLAVTESMWQLYQQRTNLLQKRRHLERGNVILTRLEKRRSVDSLDSQIARARAAVSMRRAELIRADTAVRNSEARVRSLVNAPWMLANRSSELVPSEAPTRRYIPVSLDESILTALENRPEIDAVVQEIEAARIRLQVARNELLPVLDVVLETYVSGLRGDYDIGRSWVDQFSLGEPSYSAGFLFEVPLHRRAARATYEKRQVEIRQLSSRLQAAIETLHAEVEVAVREVETTFLELQAKYTSMLAADADLEYLRRRWEEVPGSDRAASFILADLLDAQERLVVEEIGFTQSEVDYTLSFTRLNRAMGTLLREEQVELVKGCEGCLPTVLFEKVNAVPEVIYEGRR